MNAQTPQKFTLEEIAERKKKLLNEIHAFVQYRYGCI